MYINTFYSPSSELARAYVVAAEFYAGQTDHKTRETADQLAKKAAKVIEHIEDSETQVLVSYTNDRLNLLKKICRQ